MESFIVKEVQKRPIIYDKSLRAIENYKDMVKLAFDDISRAIEEKMGVEVPGQTIGMIWQKCVQNFKGNKEPTSGSSKIVPQYFKDMLFMKDHLSHRDPLTSEMPQNNNKSIWKNKIRKVTKKSRKMPKVDYFAEKKLAQDQQFAKTIDNIQTLLQTQTDKAAKCSENSNSIDNDYFNIIYDKLAQMSPPHVNQSFIKVLAILDEYQKLE